MWDDDFWSEEEATEIRNVSGRVVSQAPCTTEQFDSQELHFPELPPIPNLPPIQLSPDSQPSFGFQSLHSGSYSESSPSSEAATIPAPVQSSPRSPSPLGRSSPPYSESLTPSQVRTPENPAHLLSNMSGSGGWGWGSLAAKVTASAADLILISEDDQHNQHVSVQKSESFQMDSVIERSTPKSKWFDSVAAVLENVKASAGQSGREIIQVATGVLATKPDSNPDSFLQQPSPRPTEEIRDHPAPKNNSQQISSVNAASPSPAEASAPTLTFDAASWNDEWEDEFREDEKSPASVPAADYSFELNESVQDQTAGSGWLQDVFAGVRLTATQSGQEILQVSGVLTSEVIQKAKSIVPSQKSVFSDLPGRDSLAPPPSPRTLNEKFSESQMVSASDNESPEDSDEGGRDQPAIPVRYSDDETQDDSDAELSEFLWNFPELPDFRSEFDESGFDANFSLHGGNELIDEFERIGRQNTVNLKRQDDSALSSLFDEISNALRQKPDRIKSSLVTSLLRITEEMLNWHRSALRDCEKLKHDIFALLDWVQALCTRTLAILTARSLYLLLHSIQQWEEHSTGPLILARVLRRFTACFEEAISSILVSTIDTVRQLCKDNDDDIEILYADIEVDVCEARLKIEDAVHDIVPMLHCIAARRFEH